MSEDKKTETSELSITTIISYLTICSFTFGSSYLIIYYSFFYFNVFNYIDLNEIVTHIIRDEILVSIPYLFVLFTMLSHEKEAVDSSSSTEIKRRNILLLIISAFVIFFFSYCYFTNKIDKPLVLILLFTSIVSFFVGYGFSFRNTLKKLLLEKYTFKNYLLIFLLVISICTSFIFSLLRVEKVKYLHSNNGSYIIAGKDTIKSTNTYYYIGRTNNYVFFYNEKTEFTDVFSEKDISKVSIKE